MSLSENTANLESILETVNNLPGWWGGKVYKSLLAANVYTPEQYPAGREEQT